MKTEWINYKNLLKMKGHKVAYSRLQEIEKNLSPKNKHIIEEFLTYCKGSLTSPVALDGKKRMMLQIYDVVEKPLSQLNLKLSREVLAVLNNSYLSNARQNDIKKTFKRFLKFYYKNYNEKFNNFEDQAWTLKDERNHKKLNSDTMLTAEEIEKIIKVVDVKYKALISLMFESAGRPEEILNLTWKDLNLVKNKVTLYSNKTGKLRTIPIGDSVHYIMKYKDTLEIKEQSVLNSDLIFPSPKDIKKPMSGTALSMYFKMVGKRANLKKRIFPYLLRHTRLTPLIQKLSAKTYEHFAGHSLATGMRYYGHLNNETLDAEILEKVYNEEELSTGQKQDFELKLETLQKDQKIMKNAMQEFFIKLKNSPEELTNQKDETPITLNQGDLSVSGLQPFGNKFIHFEE